ncbi:hypothetical protein Hypma_014746 [Hypsizygus marmoreus]|uniref:Uncharacterized protein n=1 Tax=Hypsizygus marmoreus TaxID=39966 RepID=A0A369JDJ2_HYPMA|nr:hypothetical protein Hypma_014746 [Hypsizygus marmoreus]
MDTDKVVDAKPQEEPSAVQDPAPTNLEDTVAIGLEETKPALEGSSAEEMPQNVAEEKNEQLLAPKVQPATTIPVDPQSYAPLDRPLNVTDTLSYFDAVKVQFQGQPNVYNHFLDIMREFKNKTIDTPGVIKRVSHLFNGHPSLIQGFNTFLPVGYRIECSTDAHDANFITVTTPTGPTMQTTNNGPGKGPILWSTSYAPSARGEPLGRPASGAEGGGSTPILSPDARESGVDGQAIEHAVQYVQKVKQRCDPETYLQFLEMLTQYHAKPHTINEEDMSRQVARLFKDAPDLRSDFRIFMPERSQQIVEDP